MENDADAERPDCFVIMPISDVEGYAPGHFGRVYEYIIRPACKAAGLNPIRGDEVQVTNYIVIDVLRRVLETQMAICDLSSRNPNVLYELGIRQAFNLPVTIIRDSRTPRIFDIQGLRDIEYDEGLRVDKISSTVESLTNTLRNNANLEREDVNSIIQLLGLTPANLPTVEVSTDTKLLLEAINDIRERITRVEHSRVRAVSAPHMTENYFLPSQGAPPTTTTVLDKNNNVLEVGKRVRHPRYGEGIVRIIEGDEVFVEFSNAASRKWGNVKFVVGQGRWGGLECVVEN